MAKSDKKYRVGKSKIQGDGAFAKQTLNPGDYIGKVHTINKLYEDYDFTELGRKHNHSDDPNVQNVLIGNERHLVAIKPIKKGQELTSDYTLQPDLEQPDQNFEKAKKGKKLTSSKAKEILHDKSVHGQPLTDKQRKFFGAIASGNELKKAQLGISKLYIPEKVENWVEPKYVAGRNPEGNYGYSDGTIWYDPNSKIENISNPWWLEHEKYHHFQTLSERNPKERRQQEVDAQVNKMIRANPELQFIPKSKLITGSTPNERGQKSFVGAGDLIYENPKTLEGEARLYENYINRGGKSIFPKQETGGWLDTYDAPQAQNGIEGTMGGLTNKGFNFNPAWGGAWQNGGKKPRISRIDPRKDKDYENIFEIIDPTGISSWDDVYRSYKKTGWSPETALEVLGAVPLLGNIARVTKPGIHLAKYSKIDKALFNALPRNKSLSRIFSGASKIGRGTDAYQAYDEWQNGGMLQPPMAGAVQTVPMAQNGSNIGTRPEDEDIREIYEWEKEYTNSPRFAYLSSKQGDSPEITQRRRDVINKFNIDEDIVRVPDGVSYVGDEGDGLKFYLSPDAGDWPSYSDINAHEIGHFPYNTGELNFPESTYNEIQARNKEFQKMKASGITNDDIEHDVSPNEVRADKNQLLYQMKKLGIYDATKDGDITPEQLDKFKKSGEWNRLQRLYNDDDILWLINNVAKNTSGVSDKAFVGASIPGSVGFTYARTQGIPSEGPYAKKTLPSAENGMAYYQAGLDFKPKTISRDGRSVNKADEYPLEKLDNLLNFTNYNKPKAKSGGWLDKYN